MEGIGSRLGRVSSRYGPAATVFNGPVRKWKKKWVLASSSSSSSAAASQSNAAQKLLLRRWTPIPPPPSSEPDGSASPPRRKFRYTPIAVVEEQRKAELRSVKEMEQFHHGGDLNVNEVFKEETQEKSKIVSSPRDTSRNNLDLALCLNGQNQNQDSTSKSS